MTPKHSFLLYEHFTTKWLLYSTYPVLLNSSSIRTVDYVDKGKGLWQKLQHNVTDLLRIANARTVYNDHTSLQEKQLSGNSAGSYTKEVELILVSV